MKSPGCGAVKDLCSPGVPENSISKPLAYFPPDVMAICDMKLGLDRMTSSSYQIIDFFHSSVALCCFLSAGLYSEF